MGTSKLPGSGPPPATIDLLLEDAQALALKPADYRPPSAGERIARAAARRRSTASAEWYTPADDHPRAISTHRATAPAHSPSEHEQAEHELNLACALVLNTPQAALHLSRLVNDRQLDPEGALVFACLLYLTKRDNPAQFWWQLAAGGESHMAAYCLCLHHRRYGEYRDADYWRRQAAALREAKPSLVATPVTSDRPLVPDEVRKDILAQCHAGSHPHLPRALESVIDRLAVDGADADFGEIQQPSELLLLRQ
jgi:hypothetical protein